MYNPFWINFCIWDLGQVQFVFILLLVCGCPVASAPFIEKIVLSPLNCFCAFSEFTWPSLYGAIFRFSVLFHWPLCLTLCQYLPLDFHSYIIVFKIWTDWFFPLYYSFYIDWLAVFCDSCFSSFFSFYFWMSLCRSFHFSFNVL